MSVFYARPDLMLLFLAQVLLILLQIVVLQRVSSWSAPTTVERVKVKSRKKR
jgi:hypothetical protein